jgi:hypothetical protein
MAKTYNTIGLVSAGDPLTETIWNEQATNVNNYRVPPFVRASKNATQSLNNSSNTFITFPLLVTDTEAPDDPMWATGTNSLITIRTAGIYTVSANLNFAQNSAGFRSLQIFRNPSSATDNNSSIAGQQISPNASEATHCSCSTTIALAVGDVIRVMGFQNSGGALNVGSATQTALSALSVAWVGQAS